MKRPLFYRGMQRGRHPSRKNGVWNNMSSLASLPSVERLLRSQEADRLIAEFGRPVVTASIRRVLGDLRVALNANGESESVTEISIMESVSTQIQKDSLPSLRPVFNLTGTVLHTNLGRAALPEEAIAAVATGHDP